MRDQMKTPLTLVYHAKSVGPVCRRLAVGTELKVLRDTEVIPAEASILRWGSRWPGKAKVELNSAEAVGLARNKKLSRQLLAELSPATWYDRADLQFPCVIRPRHHHAGQKFFVCQNQTEALQAIKVCRKGWYASELINKAREFRVFIYQNYVVAVSERFPATPEAIAWNLALGGRLVNLDRKMWPIQILKSALLAAKKLSLDLAAIDLAEDTTGRVMVFEANTAPGLRNPYTINQLTRVLISAAPEPRTKETKWKHFLHPALL